jgi:uncharacterized pyridoxal phosphate-containing UPF0001 family protein
MNVQLQINKAKAYYIEAYQWGELDSERYAKKIEKAETHYDNIYQKLVADAAKKGWSISNFECDESNFHTECFEDDVNEYKKQNKLI